MKKETSILKRNSQWWLIAIFVAVFSLLATAALSGITGFIIATNLNTDSQTAINQPVIEQSSSQFDVVSNLKQEEPSTLS